MPTRLFYDASAPSSPDGAERRTLLPVAPVSGLSERMAGHFLPACSEFKVEFTYDDPREVLLIDNAGNREVGMLMPNGDWTYDGAINADDQVVAPHPVRWQTVPAGQQWIWSRLSVAPNTSANRTDPFRWPRALRITIKAYGSRGTEDVAVQEVIVHTW